ncbi:MAG: ACT domain-containing protein [Raoultibacter sp.]
MIEQLTVFLENEKGRLSSACKVVADAKINMHALFLADTQDFGVARIFCDTPHKAAEVLGEAGYRARVIPVLGVEVPNRPGGLAELLVFFDTHDINIEYGYCFSINDKRAIDVLKVSDASAEKELKAAGYQIVQPEDIYAID